MRPGISVVVLNYNYEQYLEDCLHSICNQKRRPGEVILMDDHSDNEPAVAAIVEEYTALFNNIGVDLIYCRNDENLGTPKNMNKGLKLALETNPKPRYLMMLGADNWISLLYLSETARILDQNPKVGVVYTNAIAFGEFARERSVGSSWWHNQRMRPGKERTDYVWEFFGFDSQDDLRKTLAQRNFIHGSSLFRALIFEDGARMKPELGRAEDWDFWKQAILMRTWEAKHLPMPLLHYRQHSENQRNAGAHEQKTG